jgi:hypothetical protein
MTTAIGNALAARIRLRRRNDRPWLHPAVYGAHVVTMTRDAAGSEVYSVATCQCGWVSRFEIMEYAEQDRAVLDHWRDVIAAAGGAAAAA